MDRTNTRKPRRVEKKTATTVIRFRGLHMHRGTIRTAVGVTASILGALGTLRAVQQHVERPMPCAAPNVECQGESP